MTGAVESEYAERAARLTPGVIVFEPAVAIEIVVETKRRGLRIYGLDCFLLHPEEKIQPVMEYDLNLPGVAGDHEVVIAHLRRFIGTSFFFEVATG